MSTSITAGDFVDQVNSRLRGAASYWYYLSSGHPNIVDPQYWDALGRDLIELSLSSDHDDSVRLGFVDRLLQVPLVVDAGSRQEDAEIPARLNRSWIDVSRLSTRHFETRIEPDPTDGVYYLDFRHVDDSNIEVLNGAMGALAWLAPTQLTVDVTSRLNSPSDAVFGGAGKLVSTAIVTPSLHSKRTFLDSRSQAYLLLNHRAPLALRSLALQLSRVSPCIQVSIQRDPYDVAVDDEVLYLPVISASWSTKLLLPWATTKPLLEFILPNSSERSNSNDCVSKLLSAWKMWSDLKRYGFTGDANLKLRVDEALPKAFSAARNNLARHEVLSHLVKATLDPHCVLPVDTLTQQVLVEVNGETFDVSQVPRTGSNLNAGDRIVAIDGYEPQQIVESRLATRSGGGKAALRVQIEHHLLDSVAETVTVQVDRGGELITVEERVVEPGLGVVAPIRPPTPLVAKLSSGDTECCYVNFTRVTWDDLESLVAEVRDAKVVVLDMRGWVAEGIIRAFFEPLAKGESFGIATWQTPLDAKRSNYLTYSVELANRVTSQQRWAVLISHRTISGGEFSAWYAKQATGATLIGSATPGGLGKIVRLYDTTKAASWIFTYSSMRTAAMDLEPDGGLIPDLHIEHSRMDGVLDEVDESCLLDPVITGAVEFLSGQCQDTS